MIKKKRRYKVAKKILFSVLGVEALLLISGFAYIKLRPTVVEAVVIEAGTEPTVDEFLIRKNRGGSFVTDMRTIDLNMPGIYEVEIQIGNKIHTSKLEVVDHTAPIGTAVDRIVLLNEDINPSDFVKDIVDNTDVLVEFLTEPDTSKPGEQKVGLLLKDMGGNLTELEAKMTVLDIKHSVTIEAGSVMNITEKDFVEDDRYQVRFLTDIMSLDISKPTVHTIELQVNDRVVTGSIEVVDTTAPVAKAVSKAVWKDENPPAISFVEEIRDISGVKASYKKTPDFSVLGDQEVTIVLEDEYGNTSEYTATITVQEDTEPPQIIGAIDKTVYIGDTIAYRKGISVIDNKDQDLTFQVDSSKVNLNKEGTYTVTYTAEDKAGNKTVVTSKITVKKLLVSEDTLNELCDKVLKSIIKDSMTQREKAKAIYTWVKRNVTYTGHSDKSDWMAEAYRGFTDKVGDCFTFFSVSQALLNRVGIDNMMVTRVGGRTQHYWSLVNCGDGWYHFDSTPNKDKKEAFMLTDKEVAELTKSRGNNYYIYDTSLYPATPEE